jgi:hypothetical protein
MTDNQLVIEFRKQREGAKLVPGLFGHVDPPRIASG